MKFEASVNAAQSAFSLRAFPDGYTDGSPLVNALEVDSVIQNLDSSRVAIAGSLAFSSFVGNEVSAGSDVFRMAAEAVSSYFLPSAVSVRGITDVPRSVWPASGTLRVEQFDGQFVGRESGDLPGYVLQVADSSQFNGALAASSGAIIASNAEFIGKSSNGACAMELLHIAIGVMFSQDLHVHSIRVRQVSVRDAVLERCKALLRSADLNLEWY